MLCVESTRSGTGNGVPHREGGTIHEPGSLGDALAIYAEHPDALLFAGGTWLMHKNQVFRVPLADRRILWLGRIEELR